MPPATSSSSAHIIHASLDVLGAEPRVSADVRFIPAGEPPDPRWLRPWSGDDGY